MLNTYVVTFYTNSMNVTERLEATSCDEATNLAYDRLAVKVGKNIGQYYWAMTERIFN